MQHTPIYIHIHTHIYKHIYIYMSRVHLGVSPNAEIPLHTYRTRQHTPHPTPNTQHTTHNTNTKHNDGIDRKHKNTSAKSLEKYHLKSAYVSNHIHTPREKERKTHTQSESTSKSTKAVRPVLKRT